MTDAVNPTAEDQDVPVDPNPGPTLSDVYGALMSLTDLVEQLLTPGRAVDPSEVELRA